MVMGPTVASKEITRSAGASPMLTCIKLALAGVIPGGMVLEPPPQAILTASKSANPASVKYCHRMQKPFARFTGNCIYVPFRTQRCCCDSGNTLANLGTTFVRRMSRICKFAGRSDAFHYYGPTEMDYESNVQGSGSSGETAVVATSLSRAARMIS